MPVLILLLAGGHREEYEGIRAVDVHDSIQYAIGNEDRFSNYEEDGFEASYAIEHIVSIAYTEGIE